MSELVKESDLIAAASAVAVVVGEITEQIILFGSVLSGKAHPESDVDLAVIVSERPQSFLVLYGSVKPVARAILNREVDISVFTRAQFERNCQFHLNVEHAIAHGKLLLDTGRRAEYSITEIDMDQLRHEAYLRMRDTAQRYIDRIFRWQSMQVAPLDFDACLDAMEAICWALRAKLLLSYVDTSAKHLRENPAALAELAVCHGIKIPAIMVNRLKDTDDVRSFAREMGGHHIPETRIIELRDMALKIFSTL